MKSWTILAISFVSLFAWAQPRALALPSANPERSSEQDSEFEGARPVHLLLAYGNELRPERDLDANFAQHFLTNYALGFGYQKFLFVFERATFEESSGNSSLSVIRRLEDTMAWVQWRSLKWKLLVPFLGGGIGAYKEKVTTNLAGAPSVQNETSHRFLGGGSFGVSLDITALWISVEGRMLFGDELDQQPTLGGVARIGLWF